MIVVGFSIQLKTKDTEKGKRAEKYGEWSIETRHVQMLFLDSMPSILNNAVFSLYPVLQTTTKKFLVAFLHFFHFTSTSKLN